LIECVREKYLDQLSKKLPVASDPVQKRRLIEESRPRSIAAKAVDGLVELPRIEGLGDVTIHSRRETTLAVSLHGVSRHGHDRDVLSAPLLPFADRLRRFETFAARCFSREAGAPRPGPRARGSRLDAADRRR
jgi:hypothetical protein